MFIIIFIPTLKIDLISWQVDLVRVDLMAIDLVRIDLVTPSQREVGISRLRRQSRDCVTRVRNLKIA